MSDEIPGGFSMPQKARPAPALGVLPTEVVGDELGYAAALGEMTHTGPQRTSYECALLRGAGTPRQAARTSLVGWVVAGSSLASWSIGGAISVRGRTATMPARSAVPGDGQACAAVWC